MLRHVCKDTITTICMKYKILLILIAKNATANEFQ